MSLNIKTTNSVFEVAEIISSSILKQLDSGKKVLFFVTGGSSIAVCSKIADILKSHPHHNLTIMLTDERYGSLGHSDSNWSKLIETGFDLPDANLIPILTGDDRDTTTEKFIENLKNEFTNADFKMGLFGVGADGHTAGILPGTVAVENDNLACGYDTEVFSRITITKNTIEKLDEIFAFIQGENKWPVIRDLEEKDVDIIKQPAQILKRVPLLTIFTDYKKI